jgi:hypothetical protein
MEAVYKLRQLAMRRRKASGLAPLRYRGDTDGFSAGEFRCHYYSPQPIVYHKLAVSVMAKSVRLLAPTLQGM